MTKPKMGRPRRAKKESDARLVARCTEAELKQVETACFALGATSSEVLRAAVFALVRDVRAGSGARWLEEIQMSRRVWVPE